MHSRETEKSVKVYSHDYQYRIVVPSNSTLTHLKRTCRLFRQIIRAAVHTDHYHAVRYFLEYPNVYLNK
jgi:hypothetical protein